MCCPMASNQLEQFDEWVGINFKGKSHAKTRGRVLLASVVYCIWKKERNARQFSNQCKDTKVIQEEIFEVIRCRLFSFKKVKQTDTNRWLQSVWSLVAAATFVVDTQSISNCCEISVKCELCKLKLLTWNISRTMLFWFLGTNKFLLTQKTLLMENGWRPPSQV